MSLEPIAFAALAVVLIGSALAVVLTKNLFHSVLWLALTLTGTAGIFLTLDAEFIAAVQLLLYAGGVITIAVFAIVVTERLVGDRQSPSRYATAAEERGGKRTAGSGQRQAASGRRSPRMTLEIAAFWTCAATLVGSALAVVLGKNLFHSVLWLALALVATAAIFLTLDAEFLAAVQVLLYAGGVVTVVVFAIVVTERLVGQRLSHVSRRVAIGGVTCAALLAVLVRAVDRADLHVPKPALSGDLTAQVGTTLLTRYVLPFELLAVLLVVGLLAASYFARPED